jgi:hypothetical protein
MGGMGFGSMGSAFGRSVYGGRFGKQQRAILIFSMVTSINPFTNAPHQNPDQSDEELLNILRIYLSTLDLMTIIMIMIRKFETLLSEVNKH